MPPRDSPNNPHWPPSTVPSLGGAPHGLQSSESEGVGTGRCVAILCGGPSGGHNAAVLNAVGDIRNLNCLGSPRLSHFTPPIHCWQPVEFVNVPR